MTDGSISLYFALQKGRKADLEVVAAAAIQWVEAVRAAAALIDPDAHVRIEFVDAEESSLRLNTILEWAEEQLRRIEEGSGKYPRLRKLAIALAVFVAVEGGPAAYNFYFPDSTTLSLSAEDRQRIDDMIDLLKDAPEVEAPRQRFFRTLSRDPAISGVGIPSSRPSVL